MKSSPPRTRAGVRRTIATAVAAVTVLVAAVYASAAVDARLGGKFKVVATLTATDVPGQQPGDKVTRIYKFKPLCETGSCDQVRIARESSTGTFVSTVLNRTAPGIYDGTEVQEEPVCSNGDPAEGRTVDIHVEIVKKERGKATKIKGTLEVDTQGCEESFQDATFVGKRL